ncbi:hypothetical protein TRIP_B250050 [uncultured Desulfatiglans sp.]|nr:hypothetical protein TRIP_B250050 [uncultured Desulfatiglans sp.]
MLPCRELILYLLALRSASPFKMDHRMIVINRDRSIPLTWKRLILAKDNSMTGGAHD